jgi:hypothetical protein
MPSTRPLDQYENALIQYLKRSNPPALTDLLKIWGWRCGVDWEDIPLAYLAEAMMEVAERYDLLAYSFATPGARGAMGVMIDAAPGREWALCLDVGKEWTDSTIDPHLLYWGKIISVLASRLRMAEVVKLPGYDHEATVGPFGWKGDSPQ